MHSPFLSVIVPVYNTEKYLSTCVDSVLAQDFTDFELILIDDGSSDTSPEICDSYKLKDSRVRVFHMLNSGVGRARNIGIDMAKGQWVTFIDSDDFISSSFLGGLIQPLTLDDTIEFVHGGCMNWTSDGTTSCNQEYTLYIGDDPLLVFKQSRGLVISKLFRLSILKANGRNCEIRFDERMKIAEDLAFTIDYISIINKYAFVPEVGYFYRRDSSTSITRSLSSIPFDVRLHQCKHLCDSVENYISKFSLSTKDCSNTLSQRGRDLLRCVLSLYETESEYYEREQIIIHKILLPYRRVLSDAYQFERCKAYKILYILLINRHMRILDYYAHIMIFCRNIIVTRSTKKILTNS